MGTLSDSAGGIVALEQVLVLGLSLDESVVLLADGGDLKHRREVRFYPD